MKLGLVAGGALLAALTTARVATSPRLFLENVTQLHDFNGTQLLDFNATKADDVLNDLIGLATGDSDAEDWNRAVNLGRSLHEATKSKDSVAKWFFKNYPDFAETLQSPFDGDLRQTLREWGYNDNEELSSRIEDECDFEVHHKVKKAFDELGLGTKAAKDGGPNQCFRIDHYDGPIVRRLKDGTFPRETEQVYENCGKEYRSTGGTFEFAVNPTGAIALMNVISTAYAAEKFVWFRKPLTHELPQIRSISDLAWGLWNRAAPSNIKDIKYLIVTSVLNPTSRELIRGAYKTLNPPKTETEYWPGIEFSMDTAGGQAILGAPVGRWAGYFLMQHKTQLGGNRFISKVRVFKNDRGSLPYLIFYVDPTPVPDSPDAVSTPQPLPPPVGGAILDSNSLDVEIEDKSVFEGSRLVGRSLDGKNEVREHIIRVKLPMA